MEKKIYEDFEKEGKQAIADRQILGEEVLEWIAKLGEKEKELRELEEKYQNMERELEEEKLKNKEYEKELGECKGEEGKLKKLVEKTIRMVEEGKSL